LLLFLQDLLILATSKSAFKKIHSNFQKSSDSLHEQKLLIRGESISSYFPREPKA
jgi:hypothetical protein